ncbi:hypothetical protein [Pseudofrankia sp. BMG5.37]|uniref:hypothetical protein n=1 Tax=Pseudofrankia sp. BMG5.37 TaxID=3050035 RepID=UPI0028948FB4|nr:hypothetical protein [Pseudofrankia sp. BMG5.37]MDT3440468.1 hypothetical protein [Pseudofrankia sp. BMG5.37]
MPYRRRDSQGLLAFARACAERDAAAPYPDAESGPTEPPFETVIARHAAVWGERLGRGYQHGRVQAWCSVEDARARLAGLELVREAARGALATAEAEHFAALAALAATGSSGLHGHGPGGRFHRAYLASSSPRTRAAGVGVGAFAQAALLTPPAEDGWGAFTLPYLGRLLLVAAVACAGMLLAGHLARQARDERLAAERRHAAGRRAGIGRTVRGVAGLELSPAAVAALVALAVADVGLAFGRASAGAGRPFGLAVPVAFALFLAAAALVTAVVAAAEYRAHDPLAAAVHRAGQRAAQARFAALAASRRALAADAAERAAVRQALASVAAFRGLYGEERARLEIVRDSYRADLVARCDVERAAALAALPRKPWPGPAWLDALEADLAALAAEQRPRNT